MADFLLDASVILGEEDLGDPHHHAIARLLRSERALATLDLAYYEVANVAIRSWRSKDAALRLRFAVDAIAADGGLVRADAELLQRAESLAGEFGITVYDAAYATAARMIGATLVSCDVRDLVSNGLAILPAEALGDQR